MIADRYEADIAFSFAHSLRRNICHELWRPVAYSFPPPSKHRALSMASVFRRIPVQGHIDAELVATALRVPGFTVAFRDLRADSERIVERINFLLDSDAPEAPLPVALDVVEVEDRKSTRLNSSHTVISYAVFCLKKKNNYTHYPFT